MTVTDSLQRQSVGKIFGKGVKHKESGLCLFLTSVQGKQETVSVAAN